MGGIDAQRIWKEHSIKGGTREGENTTFEAKKE